MPQVSLFFVAAGLVVCVGLLSSCSDEPAENTVGVVYCTSPLLDEGRVEQVEYRQDGEVIASTELEVGTTYRAEVPADGLTEIYVDGRLAGSSGNDDPEPEGTVTGGHTALLGEGCPDYIEP